MFRIAGLDRHIDRLPDRSVGTLFMICVAWSSRTFPRHKCASRTLPVRVARVMRTASVYDCRSRRTSCDVAYMFLRSGMPF